MNPWRKIFKRNPLLDQITPNQIIETITQMMLGTYATITVTFKNGIIEKPDNPKYYQSFIDNLIRRTKVAFTNKKGNTIPKYKGLTILLVPEISTSGRIHYHGIMTHKHIDYGSFLGLVYNKLKLNGLCYGEVHHYVDDHSFREITLTFGIKQKINTKKRDPRDVIKYILKDRTVTKDCYKPLIFRF